jgi:hypothetical protein
LLANGDVAVALYNKNGAPQPPIPGPPCTTWTHTFNGYYEACGGYGIGVIILPMLISATTVCVKRTGAAARESL